ncbi:hypothetical protein AB4166_10270 [Vibrio splendidus]|uniref:hypothetical protein n=1 Tax=Vibrio splendidus TaxID=29497 RepID=UPI001E2B721E|nr:hypothetical protein [Vibrio splendidus]MCC4863300.1 hypothetical protein [Vibrio splendidus]
MLDLLKVLQENQLLTPLSTMFTGLIAVIAVLINNLYLRRNLTRQIEAQSKDSDKKIVNERWIIAREEKQLKLEVLYENLQMYLDILNDSHKNSMHIAWRETGSYTMKYNDLSTTRDSYVKGQSYRRKALILGYSYSDSKELSTSLDELKLLDEQIKQSFNKLTNSFVEAELVGAELHDVKKVTNQNSEDLLNLTVRIKNNIEKIEGLVTKEIRESRSPSSIVADI